MKYIKQSGRRRPHTRAMSCTKTNDTSLHFESAYDDTSECSNMTFCTICAAYRNSGRNIPNIHHLVICSNHSVPLLTVRDTNEQMTTHSPRICPSKYYSELKNLPNQTINRFNKNFTPTCYTPCSLTDDSTRSLQLFDIWLEHIPVLSCVLFFQFQQLPSP